MDQDDDEVLVDQTLALDGEDAAGEHYEVGVG